MIIHNMDQNSPEWEQVRCGKWTASNFHIMMSELANKKSGQMTLLFTKSAEHITGLLSDATKITNKHIERGNIYEPYARNAYKLKTGHSVQMVGFIEHDVTIGCSPDGLVEDDGIIEIKCPDSNGFLNGMLSEEINSQYLTQMQFCLYVTERQWCDYVIYNVQFFPSIFIQRINRDEAHIQRIADKLVECNLHIDEIVDHYLSLKEKKGE